jgi:XapX domain-containing protein
MSDHDSTAIEYIKVQWADIHHSRLQDWSALGVIAGVLYAIANIQSPEPRVFLGLLGLLSSFLGACMAWQHYQVFKDKMVVIGKMEQRLGIQYPQRRTLFPVQILIFLLFGGIASTFASTVLYFWSEIPRYALMRGYALPGGVLAFAAFLAYALARRVKFGRGIPYRYDEPFYAEAEALRQCLHLLEDKPLKLIAGERLAESRFTETPWDTAQWTFSVEGGVIYKPVLLNHRDVFQFSVADASSRQDWHYHRHVFEIYVSNDPISLEYSSQSTGGTSYVRVESGVLIVPPGLPHKVNLQGTTFVFQASLDGGNLGGDKVRLDNPA